MSFLDKITGKEQLLNEIAELRLQLRRLKRNSGSKSGMKSIVGLDELVLQLDNNGNIEYANTSLVNSINKKKDEVIGVHYTVYDNFVFGPGILKELLDRIKISKEQQIIERVYLDPTVNKNKYIELTGTPYDNGYQIRIKDVSELKNLEEMFGRYVSPEIIEKMKNSSQDFFRSDRYNMTVLFCDLRGFTSMSEKLKPDKVRQRINDYLCGMTDIIINKYQATIDKFVGDEIMALFGAPILYEDHVLKAIKVALDMIDKQKEINKSWGLEETEYIHVGIGINTGEMVVGNIGSPKMVDYTVLGHHVNLGARLCEKAPPQEIWISEYSYNELNKYLESNSSDKDYVDKNIVFQEIDSKQFKGISNLVKIYKVERKNG